MVLPYINMYPPQAYTCSPSWPPPPSFLPIPSLWVVSVHQPQASGIMHWTWAGDSFHIWYYTYFSAILPNHPTLSLSHRVQKTVLYICVSFGLRGRGRGWDNLGEWRWIMYNIICETSWQSRFNAWYWMLGAGALRRPRGVVRGGRRRGGFRMGTRVYLWRIHVDVWQNQYNIVK